MTHELPDLYDGPHSDIVGATGSGKTTLAARMYENAPGVAIYVDPSGEVPVNGAVVDMSEGEAFDPSVLAENRRIVIIPPDGAGSEADMRFIEQLQSALFSIGDEIPHNDGRFYVFIDEAHEFAPLHADPSNPIIRMSKRGRKRNIRLFMVSQSPADMSKKAVKQMKYHVIFAVNDYDSEYLDRYGMPADEIKERLGRPDEHRFVIYDGFDLDGPFKLDLD